MADYHIEAAKSTINKSKHWWTCHSHLHMWNVNMHSGLKLATDLDTVKESTESYVCITNFRQRINKWSLCHAHFGVICTHTISSRNWNWNALPMQRHKCVCIAISLSTQKRKNSVRIFQNRLKKERHFLFSKPKHSHFSPLCALMTC